MDDSAYYAEVARYALVYPAVVVVPVRVLTVFRPDLGRLLLIVAAVVGGLVFTVLGGDTRAEQVTGAYGDSAHFQQDAPERKGSGLTNSIAVFGIGLFVLAVLAFVVSIVVR